MKVINKQRNSKMCYICGMDNPIGFKSQFYDMEDGCVISPVRYQENHQSFPLRVHGGLITTILDEIACRAYWHNNNYVLGVTTKMETKFRKPVPYEEDLFAHGIVLEDKSRMFQTHARLIDRYGIVYAESIVSYIKLPAEKIVKDVDIHHEMPYLIKDNITDIDYQLKL